MSKKLGMQQRTEFHKIFREKIKPVLRNYEVYRKKAYEQHVICTFIIAVILLLGIGFTAISVIPENTNREQTSLRTDNLSPTVVCTMDGCMNTDEISYKKIGPPGNPWAKGITIIMIFVSVFYAMYIRGKNKDFKLTLKRDCLEKVLKAFDKIEWQNNSQKELFPNYNWIPEESLKSSGLFIDFHTRETDDEFKGSFQGVDYEISETKLSVDDSRNRISIEAFKGIIIRFKCNKNIKNRTIISTKGNLTQKNAAAINTLVGSLSCIRLFKGGFNWAVIIIAGIIILATYLFAKNRSKKEEALDKVTLEDAKFSKRFNVYSSDQVEARYLVTPSFMERLYNLQTSFGAKTIKCSFYQDYLMIAISTKQDLFELGDLFHPLLESNSHVKLFMDIHSILNMVEYFKLDEKVGL